MLFTAAWIASSLRQTGHSAAEVQLSGLAAIDAHDPQIMMAGFVALGAGSVAFGAALGRLLGAKSADSPPPGRSGRRAAGAERGDGRPSRSVLFGKRAVTPVRSTGAAGPRPTAGSAPAAGSALAARYALAARAGPWLVVVAGAAAIAAGLLRRDHMLLVGPGFAGESWHNQAHDIVSGVAYAAMVAAPILLARRFRADPAWAALRPPVLALALASAIALLLFSTRLLEPWSGVVQRFAVTLPLAAEALTAAQMLVLSTAAMPPDEPRDSR